MVGFAVTAVVILALDAAGAWHVPTCVGNTSSGCEVAASAVSGVDTGADASIMSVSIGMAAMLAGSTPYVSCCPPAT